MTTRRSASSPASKTRKRLNKRRAELRRRAEQRRLELEKLEDRVVLTGPQLAGILPNGEELLDTDGTTRLNIAPRELTISFDETQQFNDAAIQDSIRLIRSGGDMAFGDANDVVITPGFLGSRDAPNGHQIVMRFQDSLPDDHYRVELFAFDDGSQNITALRNINGEVLQSPQGLDRISVDFELDLGAQIISVVPQPIRRDPNTGDLIQDDQQIVVYFNDDDLHEEKVATGDKNPDPTVVDPAFYQLHFTNDTASNQDDLALFGPNGFANPQSVVYDPALDVAVLTFAQPLQNLSPTGGAATWRLRIGTDEAIAAPPDPPVDLLGPGTADVGFDISLLFPDDSLTESQQEIIRDAADRWEQIIIGDLPNEGLIDDIEITVRAQPGDGVGANWILGDSGPTANRRDSFLPYKGEIRFDSFDVRDREIHQQQVEAGLLPDYNVPTLFETAAREIGHALGFRRIWDELGLIQGAGTADPRFSGAIATAEYNAALNISGVSVPLENTTDREDLFGTFDTRETKWREQFFEPTTNGGDLTVSTLQNELFSGYLSQPELPTMRQPHLISRVTIGAFADMGYEVDLNAADDMVNQLPYIPPVEMAATDEPGSSFDTAFDLEPNLNTTLGVTVSALVHSSIDDSFHSNGLINVIADGSHLVDGSFLIIRAADGDEHLFEFNDSLNPGSPTLENPGAGTSLVPFTVNDTIEQVRDSLFTAIDANGIVAVSKFSDHFILLDGDSHDLRSSVRLSGNIAGVTTMDPLLVNFDEAGGQDEPGHRDNQVEEHIRGDRKDVTNGITTVYYNFKDHYGFDIDGNALDNTITETQKLRAREIFELYNNFLGVQFVETASEGITIVTGDMRAVREDVPTGPGDALSISGGGIVVMDAAEAWNDDFGGNWYREATRQIGKALGMGNSFELPLGTVQGLDLESPLASTTNPDVGVVNTARPEPVFPGDHDLVHGERLYRPEQNDLDIYRIRLDESGLLSIETFAERLANSSPLDTTVTLWTTKVDTNGNIIFDSDGRERQQLIARNDDYFSEDSFLQLELDAGVYFIGVSASGNDTYDPTIENTGYGGKTEGDYDLRVSFRPASDDGIIDDTSVRLDGDSDGRPGGEYNFWFRTAQPSDGNPIGTGDAVVYVDKVNEPPVGQAQPNGTLANPFNTIVDATDFISTRRAGDPESEFIIRIVGNGGSDDDLRTVGDNAPYEIGFRPPFNIPLEDGARLDVPPNTVVMIDEGAVLKFRGSSINVGSESPAIDRSGGAVQLLGTPFLLNDARDDFLRNGLNDPVVGSVFMTSWDDEAIGADTNPAAAQDPARGDWGGVLFRTDQENVEARKQWEDLGIFLNYVNHTDFRYGGGKIVLNSVQTTVAPIHMIEARPTVSFNTFTENASAGLSADPNSFLESTFHDPATQFIALFTSDYTRIGPDVHNNRLSSNQTNGMAIRIDTLPGNNLRPQTVSARWDDTDIVHVLTNPLILQGTPGGAFLDKTIVPVDLVTFPPVINGATGSLNAGDLHRYRVTFIDAEGNESPPSVSTPRVGQVNVDGVIDINNLPPTPFGSVFIGRRIYRSDALVQVTTIQSASAVLNEIQHVLLPGPPSGSTFILDFAGVSTAPISDGASDAEVLAALEALPTIAPGDVAVALIPGGWSVEFTGKFANLDVAEMVGDSGNYTMIAQRDASDTTYEDDGTTIGGMLDIGVTATSGLRRARPDARLRIDGGTVVKMDQARIEVGVGAQLLAEGDSGNQVVITSRRDDRFGGLGTFDTNNDDGFGALETAPVGGDWGGVIVRPGGSISLDHGYIAFGGGITEFGGSFAAVNPLELHQAVARVANSTFTRNEIGQGGQAGGPTSDRFGLGFNAPAAIFVRGGAPIIYNNLINDNLDLNGVDNDPQTTVPVAAISINVNALNSDLRNDFGRSTGLIDRVTNIRDNFGALLAENQLSNNGLNGVDVRGGILTTAGVWDDTDIVHIVRQNIDVVDRHTEGGLLLKSSPQESLVVKVAGAGFTANGRRLETSDRIGGALHILGQPGFPIIITSLADDTVGAGFDPSGDPQVDSNNDGGATAPVPGDWRSIRIDEYAHDRNVELVLEQESVDLVAPGINSTTNTAQVLGSLAPDLKSGDDELRLGFVVRGFFNDVNDLDVYSFTAQPGTEVFFDLDRTSFGLDTVVELLDADGQIVAQSDNSYAEMIGQLGVYENNPINADLIDANNLRKSVYPVDDLGTLNPLDGGFRIVLPGTPNPPSPPTYHVRLRSSNLMTGDDQGELQDPARLLDGHTDGVYELQIRLQEQNEYPGSSVKFADIRYATNGVEIFGQPSHSPLTGDAIEILNAGQTDDTNNQRSVQADALGNILATPQGSLAFSGVLGVPDRPGFAGHPGFDDVDFFRFEVNYEEVESIFDSNNPANPELNNPNRSVSLVFDLDYGDQVSTVDTILTVYDEDGVLIMTSDDSNVAPDRSAPLNGADLDDLNRGSVGELDPFIGPVVFPEGTFFVAVHSKARVPNVLGQYFFENPRTILTRSEPITSIERIADEHFDAGGAGGTVIVDHDDNSGVDIDRIIPAQDSVLQTNRDFDSGVEAQAANRVDLKVSGVATPPKIDILDDESIVPWNLGDVSLYVAEDIVGTNTIGIRISDPFTGQVEVPVGTLANDVGDIAFNGIQLHAFTTEQRDGEVIGNVRDSLGGRFLDIDWGNAQIISTQDDGIDTYIRDVDGNVQLSHPFQGARIGWGMDFEAMAFGPGGLYAIGSRLFPNGDFENPPDPEDTRNVLYRFRTDGVAQSWDVPDRTGDARVLGAGTEIVERGILEVDDIKVSANGEVNAFGTSGAIAEITGMTFIGGTLYAVTDFGELYTVSNYLAARNSDVTFVGYVEDEFGVPIPFTSLDAAPGGVEEGAYGGMLFGATQTGDAYAFFPDRVAEAFEPVGGFELEPIFFNGARTIDISDEDSVVGISFSPLQTNLWRETGARGTDVGHGVNPLFDDSRLPAGGATSLYFGTLNFPGGTHGVVESNTFDLSPYSEDDLPYLYFNYYLETEDADDQSELFTDSFRTFVTDDTGEWELLATNNEEPEVTHPMFDVQNLWDVNMQGQVSIADNIRHGVNNNSATFDGWRQARINLGPYAGRDNVRLRFEFQSSGDSNIGDALTTGEEFRAIDGSKLRDGQSIELQHYDGAGVIFDSTRYEVDLGFTLVAPSGSKIVDGDIFTIDGVTYEFDDDDLNGNPFDLDGTLDNVGDGVSIGAHILVPFTTRMSAEEVAEKMQIAIEGGELMAGTVVSNFVAPTFHDLNASDTGFNHNANDTIYSARRTPVYFGEYEFTADGLIGNNPNNNVVKTDANDVDLYKVRINERSQFDVSVTTTTASPVILRLFDSDGVELTTGSTFLDISYDPSSPVITGLPVPQTNDPPGTLPRIGNGTSPGVPFPNGDPGSFAEEGFYYIGVSSGFNFGYDPLREGTGVAGANNVDYELTINVSNPDAPRMDPSPLEGLPVTARVHGDDRLAIEHPYTFINTHRDGNRINVPYARTLSSSITGAPNTPFARFIEGAPGVDIANGNESIVVHAGMSPQLVAEAFQHALADDRGNGHHHTYKTVDETVKLISHTLSANDFGPTGNTPGALGINRIGHTGTFANHLMPGDNIDFANNYGAPIDRFFHRERTQENVFEGVYIDDIIVGFAERGETITGLSIGQRINLDTDFVTNPEVDADAVLDGAYQVEIRRAADYNIATHPTFTSALNIAGVNYASFDTNARLEEAVRLVVPAGNQLADRQIFTLSDGLNTLTFEFNDLDLLVVDPNEGGVAPGHVEIGFRDYFTANEMAENVRAAVNSPQTQAVLNITAALSDGIVTGGGSSSSLVDLFGPAVLGNIPDNVNLGFYDPFDFGDITTEVSGVRQRVEYRDGSFHNQNFEVNVTGDRNVDRPQGQIIVSSNRIAHSQEYGIRVDAGQRDGNADTQNGVSNNPHAGPVRNLKELNPQALVPGPTLVNNLIFDSSLGGIWFSGDAALAATQQAPVPVGRIVNNTIFGGGQTGVGIEVSENAAPSLLNNVLAGLNTGISVDASSSSPFTILSGTVFANNQTNSTSTLGLGDFAVDMGGALTALDQLFVNVTIDNFYLAPGAPAVDSAVNQMNDRDELIRVRDPLGIPASPVLAPSTDLTGQLRVTDALNPTPTGQPKDRGALDRADFVGPTALLIKARDNDAEGLDVDPSETVVVRPDGAITHFEVQLNDGFGEANPLGGIGVDDTTMSAESVTVTRDGVFLQEGIDYSFSYNETSNIIRLTSLAGLWEPDRVYVITLNNRDRFVVTAPSGGAVSDGDQFEIEKQIDPNDPLKILKQVFEYDSGYTMQVPSPLTIEVPVQGGGPGGVGDGQTFELTDPNSPALPIVFEFNLQGTQLLDPLHEEITFNITDTHDQIADAIVAKLAAVGMGLAPSALGDGTVHVATGTKHTLDVSNSNLQVFGNADAVSDGGFFSIDGNSFPLTEFEFDDDGAVAPGRVSVKFSIASTREDIANAIGKAIIGQSIGLNPTNFGGGNLHIGGLANDHVVDVIGTNLALSGAPGVTTGLRIELPAVGGDVGGITDTLFTIRNIVTSQLVTFEFDSDGINQPGNVIINYNLGATPSTAEEIATNLVTALTTANIGLNPVDLGGGVVDIGGEIEHDLNPLASGFTVTGLPGGAVPVMFEPSDTFTADSMALSIVRAINQTVLPDVQASLRGGPTLFVEGATTVDMISNFFLVGVKDLAENDLRPNQASQETRFTLLLGDNRLDFGDSPDASIGPQFRFPTTLADDGARHVIFSDNPLFLGQRADSDADGVPKFDADGDDIDGDGFPVQLSGSAQLSLSDVATPADLMVAPTFSITVPADGGTGINDGEQFTISDGAQTVIFEFDRTGDGLINGGNIGIPYQLGSTSSNLISGMIEAIISTSLGLFPKSLGDGVLHLGSSQNHTMALNGSGILPPTLTQAGQAAGVADGETFTITTGAGPFVFEFDNDLNFALENTIIPITPADTHEELADKIVTALLTPDLGITPVHVGNGVINLSGNDEAPGGDGVQFLGALNSFLLTPVNVTASGPGQLDAWVDFNRDGRWDESEQVFSSEPLDPGLNQLFIQTPLTAVTGDTYARFRYSQLGGLAPFGLAASGEVEDYKVTIVPGRPPVAVDDPIAGRSYEIDEDQPLIVTAVDGLTEPQGAGNDSDPDSDPLVVFNPNTVIRTNSGANVVIQADGSFIYDPTVSAEIQRLAFNDGPGGPILPETLVDTFTYQAFDGFLFSNLATVSITVEGRNDIPVANNVEILNAFEDGPNVAAFFDPFDIDNDDMFSTIASMNTLKFAVVNDLAPGDGVIVNKNDTSLVDNGQFVFSPNPNVDFQSLSAGDTTTVEFTYRAIDSHGAVSDQFGQLATVSVTVTGINDAPIANDVLTELVAPVLEDQGFASTFDFDASDADAEEALDGSSLVYTILTTPGEGSVQINGTNGHMFDFDPGTDFQDLSEGQTRDVSFTYIATDQRGAVSNAATVTVTVTGVNDNPLALDDPDANTFIHDPNDFVTTEDVSLLFNPDSSLLKNDIDIDIDTLQINDGAAVVNPVVDATPLVISSALGAEVTLLNDGRFMYDPRVSPTIQALLDAEQLVPDDTFTYHATDGIAVSNEATVTIQVSGLNDAPIAEDVGDQLAIDGVTPDLGDIINATEDDPTLITANFRGDDPDADDDSSTLTFSIIPGTGPAPGKGFALDNGNGTFTFSTRPNIDFQDLGPGDVDIVTFNFRAIDRHGVSSPPGTVSITVTGVNDAPVADDDLGALNEVGTSIFIDVLSNDNDVDSLIDPTTIQITQAPTIGSIVNISAAGVIEYQSSVLGTDTFKYTVRDDELNAVQLTSNEATVSIVNTNFPIANDDDAADGATTFVGVPKTFSVIANDTDFDGTIDPTTVQIVSQPSNGTVSVNPTTGDVTYTPSIGFQGPTDTFTYNVKDNVGALSNTATVTMTVAANATPHQNPITPADINNDSFVRASDLLSLLTEMLTHGTSVVLPLDASAPFLTPASPGIGVKLYRDPSGNNIMQLSDALVVADVLTQNNGSAEGEGEGAASILVGPPMVATSPAPVADRSAAVNQLLADINRPQTAKSKSREVDATMFPSGDDSVTPFDDDYRLSGVAEELTADLLDGTQDESAVDAIIQAVFGDE